MGFIKFVTSFGFIAIFSIAILSYMIGFAGDNEVYVSLSDDDELSSLKTESSSYLATFSSDVNSSSEALSKAKIISGDETIESGGIFKNNPKSVYDASKNILRTGYKKIFGSDESFGIVLTTLISFFVMMLGLYIWKVWKGGDPD